MENITKIISGGQTGADRAAFDFALEKGIKIGGWIPKGRKAEDGKIDEKYANLKETNSVEYSQRTKLNVRDSDATLIISNGELKGGSMLTKDLAENYSKPCLHINLENFSNDEAVNKTKSWLSSINCRELNIAGPRDSEDPKIYFQTMKFLRSLFE